MLHRQSSLSIELNSAVFKIGRNSDNDLVVQGPLLSRVHAIVRSSTAPGASVPTFTLEDCSANGIWFRGERMPHATRQTLCEGDEFSLGSPDGDLAFFRFGADALPAALLHHAAADAPAVAPSPGFAAALESPAVVAGDARRGSLLPTDHVGDKRGSAVAAMTSPQAFSIPDLPPPPPPPPPPRTSAQEPGAAFEDALGGSTSVSGGTLRGSSHAAQARSLPAQRPSQAASAGASASPLLGQVMLRRGAWSPRAGGDTSAAAVAAHDGAADDDADDDANSHDWEKLGEISLKRRAWGHSQLASEGHAGEGAAEEGGGGSPRPPLRQHADASRAQPNGEREPTGNETDDDETGDEGDADESKSQEDEHLREFFTAGGGTGSPQPTARGAKRVRPDANAEPAPQRQRGPEEAEGVARAGAFGEAGGEVADDDGEEGSSLGDRRSSSSEGQRVGGDDGGGGGGRGGGGGGRGGGGGAGQGWAKRPRETKRSCDDGAEARWLEGRGELADKFGAPPFSVLDARKGYWTNRRQYWEQKYEIRSGAGRPENLLGYAGVGGGNGTSIFCPVLCELMYRWFCPAAGTVLDPFAGGSVRGCVAARLGLRYSGVELSATQVSENRRQAVRMGQLAEEAHARWQAPSWVVADSRQLPELEAVPERVHFVFSCPPYYDLERYSQDRRDLSLAPSYAEFLNSYKQIIAHSLARLAPNHFACFVVGEIRDEHGMMRNFVGDTISAFIGAGARLYNHAVMMLPLNSVPMRAPAAFKATAKLGMCHQHVLVFYKGRAPTREKIQTIGLTNAMRPVEWR